MSLVALCRPVTTSVSERYKGLGRFVCRQPVDGILENDAVACCCPSACSAPSPAQGNRYSNL